MPEGRHGPVLCSFCATQLTWLPSWWICRHNAHGLHAFLPKFKTRVCQSRGGGGNYLNPGQITGEKLRITLLGDDQLPVSSAGPTVLKKASSWSLLTNLLAPISGACQELKATLRDDAAAKKFLAFAVWNYDLEKVQVFQFTQAGLANPLVNYLSDEEIEAEPHLYDFVLTKTKTGPEPRDVKYEVACLPGRRRKDDVNKKITAAWDEVVGEGFDITCLRTGGDPWKGTHF